MRREGGEKETMPIIIITFLNMHFLIAFAAFGYRSNDPDQQ